MGQDWYMFPDNELFELSQGTAWYWDKEEYINDLMIQMQEVNDLSTHILTEYGYQGYLLNLTANLKKDK